MRIFTRITSTTSGKESTAVYTDKLTHIWAGRVWSDYDEIIGQVALCGERGDIDTTDWIESTTCETCRYKVLTGERR